MPGKESHRPFSTRLSPETRAALQSLAQSMGLKEGDLGRMFIVQKLAEAESPHAPGVAELRSLAAIVIAALSDTIDLDEARQLVTQHLSPAEGVAS